MPVTDNYPASQTLQVGLFGGRNVC